jgi:hypothetical protein
VRRGVITKGAIWQGPHVCAAAGGGLRHHAHIRRSPVADVENGEAATSFDIEVNCRVGDAQMRQREPLWSSEPMGSVPGLLPFLPELRCAQARKRQLNSGLAQLVGVQKTFRGAVRA